MVNWSGAEQKRQCVPPGRTSVSLTNGMASR